jgi:hypothetical protein
MQVLNAAGYNPQVTCDGASYLLCRAGKDYGGDFTTDNKGGREGFWEAGYLHVGSFHPKNGS